MNRLIILGGGGHSLNLLDMIEQDGSYVLEGFIDTEDKRGGIFQGYPYLGTDGELEEIYNSGIHTAAVGLGFLGTGHRRKELYCRLKQIGYRLPVFSDPSAVVSGRSRIGDGVFLGKCSVVNAGAVLGENVILNTGAVVEHGTEVGAHSHIAVNSTVCGECSIGEEVFIGAGAIIREGVRIGNNCLVGAGSVVLHDLAPFTVAYGNPCKERS